MLKRHKTYFLKGNSVFPHPGIQSSHNLPDVDLATITRNPVHNLGLFLPAGRAPGWSFTFSSLRVRPQLSRALSYVFRYYAKSAMEATGSFQAQ